MEVVVNKGNEYQTGGQHFCTAPRFDALLRPLGKSLIAAGEGQQRRKYAEQEQKQQDFRFTPVKRAISIYQRHRNVFQVQQAVKRIAARQHQRTNNNAYAQRQQYAAGNHGQCQRKKRRHDRPIGVCVVQELYDDSPKKLVNRAAAQTQPQQSVRSRNV